MVSSVVEVAGVVDGSDEPTWEELNVEEDMRWETPFPLVWFAGYGSSSFPFGLAVEGRLLLLCRRENMEGMMDVLRDWDIEQSIETYGQRATVDEQ
jgi:hypothetical protein